MCIRDRTKIISFFLLPLYTTRISTDEYGYFNTSTNYLDILIAILCMETVSYTHLPETTAEPRGGEKSRNL